MLELENRFKSFCPPEVILHDLEGILSRNDVEALGKPDSKWKGSDQREFFILSGANAVSPIHVDTGTRLTWINILTGRRIWYYPRVPRASTKGNPYVESNEALAFGQGPQDLRMYQDGWAKLDLYAGDLLWVSR